MLHTLSQARAGVTNRLDEARKTNRRLAEAGFTLIELLIVIVILGILAAVVVFSVQGITDRGVASACKADKATVTNAVEAFYAQTGAKPGNVAADGTGAGSGQLVPAFLHSWPTGGGKYTISYDSGTNKVNAAGTDIGDCATA